MKQKITIQDIADALGVSRNTVSKAINNADGLAEATRERVLQKAAEMGYKQFSYVQALRRGIGSPDAAPQQGVGVREVALLTSMYVTGSHFASTMLDRLQRELQQLGYRINTYHVRREDLAARTLPFSFDPEQVSAVVCVEMFDWDYDMMLCELGLPILFIDGPVRKGGRSLPADQLYMDSASEIRRLVGGMLEKGVRRIGFVGDYIRLADKWGWKALAITDNNSVQAFPDEDAPAGLPMASQRSREVVFQEEEVVAEIEAEFEG